MDGQPRGFPAGPAAEVSPIEPEAAPIPAARRVVIVVDDSFLAPASRTRLLKVMTDSLDEWMVGDTRVLVAHKDRTVSVVTPFTGDAAEVLAGLTEIADRSPSSVHAAGAERRTLSEIDRGLPPGSFNSRGEDEGEEDARRLLTTVEQFAEEVLRRERRSILLMRDFLDALAGVPGRKAVLYVADRLPRFAGEEVVRSWFAKYGADFGAIFGLQSADQLVGRREHRRELSELAEAASADRVILYPIGLPRDPTVRGFSAERETNFATLDPTLALGTEDEFALLELARATGGRVAFGMGAADNLLRDFDEELGSYYTLAYPSPHGGDGEPHRVEVQVRRPGVKVRYLRRYRDKGSTQQAVDQALAALHFETGINELGARVVVDEREVDGKLTIVPLRVQVPIANMALLPEAEHHVGRLSVTMIVRDASGGRSDPIAAPLTVKIPNAQLGQAIAQLWAYVARLRLDPGTKTIGIAVRDEVGGARSTLKVAVEVEKPSKRRRGGRRRDRSGQP